MSARVFGASSFQALRHIVLPVIRPGLAVIAVWTAVQVWGSFLTPFILLRDPGKQPAAVLVRTFYTEGGSPNLEATLAANKMLFAADVWLMCDAPLYQTRDQSVIFGARGVTRASARPRGASPLAG